MTVNATRSTLAAVSDALTPQQRDTIAGRFARANPGYRGVEAADVLQLLADSDCNLPEIEPFCEAHPDLLVPGSEFASRALIWSGRDQLTEPNMRGLLVAAGLLETGGGRP
jgi:hypothetical protein